MGCRKKNGKQFTSLPHNYHIRYGLNPEREVNASGTEKFVNGKQHSVWVVPNGMNGLPQNVLLNFQSEFPKSDICNGVTACVTLLVTLIVCTLGVVILERAMLDQNVGSNGREQ